MTPRQERFVHEYLIDLNATKAAIRAGYSKHSASTSAWRLLTKSQVKAAVAEGMAARAASSCTRWRTGARRESSPSRRQI